MINMLIAKQLSESEFKRYNDSQWERRKFALGNVDPEITTILKGCATKGMGHIEKSEIKLVKLGNLGA